LLLEFVIVHDSDADEGYLQEIRRSVTDSNLKIVYVDGPFNFSKKCNEGAKVATGDLILFLNDDTLAQNSDSINSMAALAEVKNIGAVGALLLDRDTRYIQHAGIVVKEPSAFQAYMNAPKGIGYMGETYVNHEVTAVTGACLMQRRELWEKIGGWDERFWNSYNDVDYCLRLGSEGFSIVQANSSEWVHFESQTRDPKVGRSEYDLFNEVWRKVLTRKIDPFFPASISMPRSQKNAFGVPVNRSFNARIWLGFKVLIFRGPKEFVRESKVTLARRNH
jgi:GT2 family glycosyltransferase